LQLGFGDQGERDVKSGRIAPGSASYMALVLSNVDNRTPRDGALVLSGVGAPALSIVYEPCGRRGRYNVARLMAEHGDAKLTDLLRTLANCPKVYPYCRTTSFSRIQR
jgi:hypothetical protein